MSRPDAIRYGLVAAAFVVFIAAMLAVTVGPAANGRYPTPRPSNPCTLATAPYLWPDGLCHESPSFHFSSSARPAATPAALPTPPNRVSLPPCPPLPPGPSGEADWLRGWRALQWSLDHNCQLH
jgi:hypothetical protein